MSSTLDLDKTFKFFRKYWPLSVENHIQRTYKHSFKYLYIVHYILTATCCFKRHLQAEFLPCTYIELRRHLEFEIIKHFRLFLEFTCPRVENQEIAKLRQFILAQQLKMPCPVHWTSCTKGLTLKRCL